MRVVPWLAVAMRRRLNALAKISTASVAAAVPAAMGSVRRRHACHYRVTLRRESRVRQIGCALQFFCATRWGLASCLASSPSHDSVIPVTDEAAALDAASVLEWASEQVSPSQSASP